MFARGTVRPGRFDLLDLALVAAVIGGAIGTYALLAVPAFHGHIVAPALDLVLDSIALVVTALVSALSWVMYRESRQPTALGQSAAFLALAIADGIAVVISVVRDFALTPSAVTIGEAQLNIWAWGRLLAAGLIIAGGIRSLRGGQVRHPKGLMAGTVALMLIGVGAVAVAGDTLTSLFAYPVPGPAGHEPQDLALTSAGVAVQIVSAGLFLAAALVVRQLWRRDRSIIDAYLAFGLVIAALAQLQGALYPGAHPEQVASADLLRLVFYVVLLLGIQAGARAALAALQSANISLERLRIAEVEHAALDERAWLARELHDGLTQDLWLAKLELAKAVAMQGLDPETERLLRTSMDAVDSGLADARQAVAALRGGSGQLQVPLCTVLERVVDEFSDRHGIQAELECASVPAGIPHRTSAEVVRIVEEALSNAGRHADPTLVRVEARVASDVLHVTIGDNGCGFDTNAVSPGHFGLATMRERAEIIGGILGIDSRPLDGTRLSLRVPLRSAEGMERGA